MALYDAPTTCPECGDQSCTTLAGLTCCERCEYFHRDHDCRPAPRVVVMSEVSEGETVAGNIVS